MGKGVRGETTKLYRGLIWEFLHHIPEESGSSSARCWSPGQTRWRRKERREEDADMWGQCGSETGRKRGSADGWGPAASERKRERRGARAVGRLGRSLGRCCAGEELGRSSAAGLRGGWREWAEGEETRPSGQKTDGELFLFLLFCFLFVSFYFKVFSKQFQIILIIF